LRRPALNVELASKISRCAVCGNAFRCDDQCRRTMSKTQSLSRIATAAIPDVYAEFEADVVNGLSKPGQKELASRYLYDDLGSALFEAITLLPEYGLTRAEMRLLRQHRAELARRAAHCSVVIDLGCGSGEKAREVLTTLAAHRKMVYCPIDVSTGALTRCIRTLDDIENVDIVSFDDSYVRGLRRAAQYRSAGSSLLVLFLGSSIGNFDSAGADALLCSLRENLVPGDLLLLSTDLVKPVDTLLAAYDDAMGLTAAFNLNILGHINRELGSDFDLDQFEHVARYQPAAQRIEMHLRSKVRQTVTINGRCKIVLAVGETIWTESSYKFLPQQIRAMVARAHFSCEVQWLDKEWPFAQSLLQVAR
jgi:L-histidine Nalpha-methyltransferase